MTDTTRQELELISNIANRALSMFQEQGVPAKKLDLFMDIEYAHRDAPMDLQKLADFPDGDFGHDIAGIYNNFNRETLKMENSFSPRCAR